MSSEFLRERILPFASSGHDEPVLVREPLLRGGDHIEGKSRVLRIAGAAKASFADGLPERGTARVAWNDAAASPLGRNRLVEPTLSGFPAFSPLEHRLCLRL